jgi:Trypsin
MMDVMHIVRLLGFATSALAASTAAASSEPSAIIGGGPVDACAWPSTVFLENCTGTLIHPEIVVYAAHCGDDRERVWFGEDISSGTVAEGAGFSVDTEYCMVNPEYLTAQEIGPSRGADFAFCKLAEPVLDVPIVPPLMGCETTILTSGADVTLVGYGGTDQDTFAVKFQVDTILHYVDDWGAAVIGGGGQSPCAGDSGGPAFVQLPDGTWRAFGIVSGPNFGNCGDAMWFATIFTAIPFIEANSGIDVSACHYGGDGQWNPSPSCGDFPLAPMDGSGTSWANGCGGGEALEWSTVCGPAFDASEDLIGPTVTITNPVDRARFDTDSGDATYALGVTAELDDSPSGVARAELVIEGTVVEGSLRLGAPWSWDLQIPAGVWEIELRATDWAGNESASAAVVIGIDADPPAPTPETSSGGGESSGSPAADTSGGGGSSTGVPAESSGDESSSAGAVPSESDGCGCRSTAGASPWWLMLGLLARRRRSLALVLATLGACKGDGAANPDTGSSTTEDPATSTSAPGSSSGTSEGSTSTGESSSTSADSSSTGPSCEVGTLSCSCSATFECQDGLTCMLDTCIPCETGTITCPCHFDEGARVGECDEGLYCFGGLCASPQPCPFVMDGTCDEPRGSGVCLIGTDSFDCCATRPDVCEEASQGGPCPDGSDPIDCGSATSSESGSSSESAGSSESSSDGSSGGSSSSTGSASAE